MKTKKAYLSTVFDELLKYGWERTGFNLILEQGEVSRYTFSETFKEFLRSSATHKEDQKND